MLTNIGYLHDTMASIINPLYLDEAQAAVSGNKQVPAKKVPTFDHNDISSGLFETHHVPVRKYVLKR